MDGTQLNAFCDYMIGNRVVGGTDPADPVGMPCAPELRAFILARLGDKMPSNGWNITTRLCNAGERSRHSCFVEQAKAFAALLREVADGIDPLEFAT